MSEDLSFYASMVTVTGPPEDFDNVAAMAGESLLPWIRQFEGYKGFIVLADREAGTAHFMTIWDSREALERSAHSRKQVREQLAKTAGAEIASAGAYTVLVADGID
jgi:heme-degrading monooxygenase HmoA